jgi:dihydrofolate synthase/folylpolyglutamate synthase
MQNYKKALKFLAKIDAERQIKLGLARVEKALALFGNPHQGVNAIHVAGTNGKGSVCAFTAQILQTAGFKVGLYTSPYLIEPTEKIRVNGKKISKNEYGKLILEIKKKTENEKIELTFFEFNTVAMFIHFAKKGIDFAVLETGMGGRLDATNVCRAKIAAITNIEMDHMEYLGNTKMKIAREKAGIIKERQTVITSEKNKSVLKLFRKICRQKNSDLIIVNQKNKKTKSNFKFKLGLLGGHQKPNAAVAVEIAKRLKIPIRIIKKGLLETRWPGRMQILQKKPLIIFDGAHNPAGTNALIESLKEMKIRNAVFVCGFSKGRDVEKMLKKINEISNEIVLTESDYNAQNANSAAKTLKKLKFEKIGVQKNPKNALNSAEKTAGNRPVIICGSLYLAKYFLVPARSLTRGFH